jgi:hypothetical protein
MARGMAVVAIVRPGENRHFRASASLRSHPHAEPDPVPLAIHHGRSRSATRPQPDRRPPATPEEPAEEAQGTDRRRGGRPSKQTAIRTACGPFSWTQTYEAWSYGTTVTVVYDASRCVRRSGRRALDLSVEGSATVHSGADALGEPIDSRPFTVPGSWVDPTNPDGWLPDWWQCSVKQAQYTWEIPSVYTFDVAARWGVWTLKVTTAGPEPNTLTWA